MKVVNISRLPLKAPDSFLNRSFGSLITGPGTILAGIILSVIFLLKSIKVPLSEPGAPAWTWAPIATIALCSGNIWDSKL